MGSCCALDAAAFAGVLPRNKLQADCFTVVCSVAAKRTANNSSARRTIPKSKHQQLVERSKPKTVLETRNVQILDNKTVVNTLEELIVAIRHEADVKHVLEPWILMLSLQEWNKIVHHVGNKHWTYAMKVFQVLTERSQFLKSNSERYELNMLESYTCMIGVLSKQGRAEEVDVLLGELRSAGVKPDTILYNAVLGVYAMKGLVEKVRQTVMEMEATGIQPDSVTSEKLILAYLTAEERQLHKALEALRHMDRDNLPASARTYTQVIDACCAEGHTKAAVHTFLAMRGAGHVPHIKTWSKMMQLYGSRGDFVRAEELMAMLRADGIPPTANVYDNFLLAYCMADSRDQAFSVFREYKGELKATLMAFNILIELCGKAGWASEALKLFSEASDANLRPDTVTYTTLINALTRGGMYKEVIDIWEKMTRNNVAPNIQTYTSLIHTFTVRGWTKKGDEICNELRRSGCTISVACYGAILCLYVRGGWYRSASDTLKEMASKGLEPDAAGYAALTAAFGDVNDEVAPLAKAMEGSELEFCRVLHNLFVPLSCASSEDQIVDVNGRESEALELLQKWAVTRTSAENCSIHNAITDALWRRGLRTRAREVMLRVQNLFDWYVVPSYDRKKWVLDLRGLSIGAAQVAVLNWLEEASRRAKDATVPEKMVIIIGRSAVGEDSAAVVKNATLASKSSTRLDIVSSLKERGYPCILRRSSGELESKTRDVMEWMSKDGVTFASLSTSRASSDLWISTKLAHSS